MHRLRLSSQRRHRLRRPVAAIPHSSSSPSTVIHRRPPSSVRSSKFLSLDLTPSHRCYPLLHQILRRRQSLLQPSPSPPYLSLISATAPLLSKCCRRRHCRVSRCCSRSRQPLSTMQPSSRSFRSLPAPLRRVAVRYSAAAADISESPPPLLDRCHPAAAAIAR